MFKKKKEDSSRLPELPRFEDIGRDIPDKPGNGVPSYESAFDKGGPVMADFPDPVEELDLPTREPAFNQPVGEYPERKVNNDLDELMPKEQAVDLDSPFMKDEPLRVEEIAPEFKGVHEEVRETIRGPTVPDLRKQFKMPKNVGNRPVFVQIDDYKDAMNNIEVLKQKIREVEYILDRLNEIKSQEQLEISNCETSLSKIKEKLISIDKKLFEI